MNQYGRTVTLTNRNVTMEIAPDLGFSLVRFIWNGIQILDERSADHFVRIRKGLGPLILPHFNQAADMPAIDNDAFPHIRQLQRLGIEHPFQHGVGRYLPWQYTIGSTTVTGELSSELVFAGYRVRDLTGYSFFARVDYRIVNDGMVINFDLEGEKPVAAGIHFYYEAVDRNAAAVSMPDAFVDGPTSVLLDRPVNRVFGVRPDTQDQYASVALTTAAYRLNTTFRVGGPLEKSFESVVLFSPEDAHFVCVEPISYAVGTENTKTRFSADIRLQLSD